MIKVELTKNIWGQRGGGLFGLKPIQLVFAAVAVVVGGLSVLWLMQYDLSIDLTSTIFCTGILAASVGMDDSTTE